MSLVGFSSPLDIPTNSHCQHPRSFSEELPVLSPAASFLTAFSPPSQQSLRTQEDAEGEVISGYTLGPLIAHGAFSTIRFASSSSSNGVVAVKIVPHAQSEDTNNESQIWASLSHEHILPLFSSTSTLYASYYFTLYCPAGSLLDIVNRYAPSETIPQDDAGMMFRQVVRGLRYMHQVAGYIHGDLKLENVLVDEMGVCRISDFGLSRKFSHCVDEYPHEEETDGGDSDLDESKPTSCALPRKVGTHHLSLMRKTRHAKPRPQRNSTGVQPNFHQSQLPYYHPGSLPYAAPELLAPSHFQPDTQLPPDANPAQDIWALGVLLYALLTGKLPFSDLFEPRLTMKILRGTYALPSEFAIGRGAERVLKGCLEKSVKERWTIDMVDEVSWGVGWGDAAWEEQPQSSKEQWEPAPTPIPAPVPPPLVSRRSSSMSRSRVRERHDPVPMTAESRSKSRSRKRFSLDVATEDEDWPASPIQGSRRNASQSKSRSQSRHRFSTLCPTHEEDDASSSMSIYASSRRGSVTPQGMAIRTVVELNRGRRTERKIIPEELSIHSEEQLFAALSISDLPLSTTSPTSSDSPSPSPSPSLDSPESSIILSGPPVRVASANRSTSALRNTTRGRGNGERGGVRFEDSAEISEKD